MPIDMFTAIREGMAQAGLRMVQDLAALPEDKVALSPGGKARKVCDFVYEVAFMNRRIAARLRGETPAPLDDDGWMVAPEECQSREVLTELLQSSNSEMLAAYDTHGPDGLGDTISLPSGETTVYDMAALATRHMNYHDAQLNYVQALFGDLEMHWE